MKVSHSRFLQTVQHSMSQRLMSQSPKQKSSPQNLSYRRVLGIAAVLTFCGAFGYAVAQGFSTLGTITVDNATASSVDLRLPELPTGATSLSLQKATVTKTAATPPSGGRVLWLKADSVSGVGDGGALARWESVGGSSDESSYPAVQSSTSARPAWMAQAINGRPSVRFDGNSDYLSLPAGLRDFSQGVSAFVVSKPTASQSWARFFDFGSGSASDNIFLTRVGNSSLLGYESFYGGFGSNIHREGILNDQFQIATVVQQGGLPYTQSTVTLYRTGESLGTGQAFVPRVVERTNNYLGKSNWPDALFQGDISEILLYQRALSTSERQEVEAYLSSKYGLGTAPTGLSWSTIATGLGSNALYQDTDVSADSQYFYRCIAVNGTDNPTGPATGVTTLPLAPATPATPTFSGINATHLRVQAASLPARASNLALQQKLASESNTAYVTVAQSVTSSFQVTGLLPETEYDFRFVAVGEGGSTVGTSASATTEVTDAPDAPAAPSVLEADSSSIELQTPALPARATTLSLQRAVGSSLTSPPLSGLNLWLKADSISSTDQAALSNWSDSSGQGNHATQATTGAQPHWIANGLNGRPVVRMDGVDDLFQLPTVTGVRTAIVVARHSTGTQDWAPLLGSPQLHFHGGHQNSLFWFDYTSNQVKFGQGYVNGQPTDVLAIKKPTDFQVITLTTTDGVNINNLANQDWTSGRSWNGDYAEVLLYDRVLSLAERQQAETYLQAKYGLGSLPEGVSPETLTWSTIATNLAANATYTDSNLSPATRYYYRCVAVGTSGSTPGGVRVSSTLPSVPATPAAPTFSEVAATHLKVNAPTLPLYASQLTLQRKLTAEADTTYTTLTSNLGDGYVVTGLTAQTSYDFRYLATGDGGQSVGTASTVTTVEFDPPAVPDLPEALSIQSTGASLKAPAFPARTTSLSLQRAALPTESDLKPVVDGLKVWLDANSVSATSGAGLGLWRDSSGGNRHATQTNLNAQPKWIANVLNGHPVVRLDGGQDGTADYLNLPSQTQVRTAIVVARHQTGNQHWAPILGSIPNHFHGGADTSLFNSQYTGAVVRDGEVFVNGEAATLLAMNKPTSFGVITLTTTGPAQVDSLSTQAGAEWERSWKGDYAEVLLYDRVLTSLERAQTEAYLLDKYSLKSPAQPLNPQWETVATGLEALETHTQSGLTPNTAYFYRCVALGPGGQTPGAALLVKTKPAAPAVPATPTLQSADVSSVTLGIPALPARAYSLRVESKLHGEDEGGYSFAGVSNLSSASQFTVSGLNPASEYDFRVLAIGIGGQTPSLPLTVSTTGRGSGTGLTGWYYPNETLTNSPAHTRRDPKIDFSWLDGSPVPGVIAPNYYSVRWKGQIQPLHSQRYKLRITCDEGARLWIGSTLLIDAWTNPGHHVGEIDFVKGTKYDIRLEFRKNNYYIRPDAEAVIKLEWESASQMREVVPEKQLYPTAVTSANGLTARYFEDENLSQFFLTRKDQELNFDWGIGSPAQGLDADTFSARWTGQIQPLYSETYSFTLEGNDGAKLWIDNQLVTEATTDAPGVGTVTLVALQKHDIKVEYKELADNARLKLSWQSASQPQEVVPPSNLFPEVSTPPSSGTGTGLLGRYFVNKTFSSSDLAHIRVDKKLDFSWTTVPPIQPLAFNNFCVRWAGKIEPLYTESYRISVDSNDRCRVYVGGNLLIDRWNLDVFSNPQGATSASVALVANQQVDVKVEFIDANNADTGARMRLLWSSSSQNLEAIPQSQLYPETTATQLGSGTGLLASYYANRQRYTVRWEYQPNSAPPCQYIGVRELLDTPHYFHQLIDSYVVPHIDFDWADGSPWGGGYGEDFSARWQGEIQPLYSETYTFKTDTDEGVRLWVNGQQLIDNWSFGGQRNNQGTITLQAGQKYSLKMEMFDARRGQTGATNGSGAKLSWSSASQPLEIVPQRQLYPLVQAANGQGVGLRGHYYGDKDHTDWIDSRIDEDIDFNWNNNTPFGTDRNTFSVRWTGYITSRYSERYDFSAKTEDVVKVWIGGQSVIDNENSSGRKFGSAQLVAGVKIPIVVEYMQSEGNAGLTLEWASQHQTQQVIPSDYLYAVGDLQTQPDYGICGVIQGCGECPPISPVSDGLVEAIDMPSQLKTGESRQVTVWMRNMGQTTWIAGYASPNQEGRANAFGLSNQGFLWGNISERACPLVLDVPLEYQTTGIAPGHVGKFVATITAPSTPGNYDASWTIYGNGSPMGDTTPRVRIRVVPPDEVALGAPSVLDTTTTSTTLRLPALPANSDGMKLQRVKQAAPDAPSTQGLKLWLRADQLTSAKAGEAIATWSDLSSQNRHATQTNAASRPLKIETGVNGRPTLQFDGKNDFMEFPLANDIRSVFMVLRDREAGKNNGSILGNHLNGGQERFIGGGTANMFAGGNGWPLVNGAGAVNGYVTAPLSIKKSTDFQVVSIQTTEAASAEMLAYGLNNTLYPWYGDIAEVLIYDSALSVGDKRSVEAYLTAKYGRPTAYEPEANPTWTTLTGTYNGGEVFTDTGLDENSTYWYRCVPVENNATPGKSAHTTTLTEIEVPAAPVAPTFSEIAATSVRVHAPALSTRANYFTLQFKEAVAPEGAYVAIEQKIVPEGSVLVSGLNPLTEYSFRYVATNSKGNTSGTAALVTTLEEAPEAPEAPSILNVEQTQATLKMPVLPLRAATLQLQKRAGSGEYVTIEQEIEPLALYTATGLSSGQSYLFRCVAVNPAGSTPGLVAAIDTDLPLPQAPDRPRFSALTDTSVDVTAPALPLNATSLALQIKSAFAPNADFSTITQGLSGHSVWSCTSLQPGTEYLFRYVAVNYSGSTPGPAGNLKMLIPQVTWSAGTSIDCLGIRAPEGGLSVTSGSVVRLDSYLATDFDLKQVVAGDSSRVTNHSDTCVYTWTVSGGSFVNGIYREQKVGWIAPSTPGTYTIGLTVDDQVGANQKATEGGNRQDASNGFNDAPQKYQVTITVLP